LVTGLPRSSYLQFRRDRSEPRKMFLRWHHHVVQVVESSHSVCLQSIPRPQKSRYLRSSRPPSRTSLTAVLKKIHERSQHQEELVDSSLNTSPNKISYVLSFQNLHCKEVLSIYFIFWFVEKTRPVLVCWTKLRLKDFTKAILRINALCIESTSCFSSSFNLSFLSPLFARPSLSPL